MAARLTRAAPITREEAELFDHVSAGTIMGEFLRRYWWPVGISKDLRDKPTFIRLLGEDLVLFRTGEGALGVLGAQCSHRGVNLCFGMSETFGIRCRYHGWLYDTDGNILDTPGEPDDTFRETMKHPAYRAQELGGAIWVYMGPEPAPLLPRFLALVEGNPQPSMGSMENHNFWNGIENGCDPLHVTYLHGEVWPWVGAIPDNCQFELIGDQYGNEWGITYKAHRPEATLGERGTFDIGRQIEDFRLHAMILPGVSRTLVVPEGYDYPIMPGGRWSVPIDDTHTLHFQLSNSAFRDPRTVDPAQYPAGAGTGGRSSASPAVVAEPFKEYKETPRNQPLVLGYTIPNDAGSQDATMRQSMGRLADRIHNENLYPTADVGVSQLRRLWLDQAHAVREGRDPMGVVRDPAQNEVIVIRGDRRWALD